MFWFVTLLLINDTTLDKAFYINDDCIKYLPNFAFSPITIPS